MRVKPVAVFLGPSLERGAAQSIIDADYYPPAAKGDVYRVLASGVRTIVLIDGVFHGTPSVWQRELLDALACGIRVIGASSMGALRAAELHPFGMIGCGTVFRWYRDGIIDGDDEVALFHASEEFRYRPLSEPLVNIRSTLSRAVREAALDAVEADALISYGKQLHYPQRSYQALLTSPLASDWPRSKLTRLRDYLSSRRVDIKKLDALAALRLCARSGSRPRAASRPSVALPRTSWWRRERARQLGFVGARLVRGAQILDAALEDRALVRRLRRRLARRRFLLDWAEQHGVACPAEFQRAYVARWTATHCRRSRAAWLRANGLTVQAYSLLVAERALHGWLESKGFRHFGLKHGFLRDWALRNGVSAPEGTRLDAWMIDAGPGRFGLPWSFEAALLEELQVTGRAAGLAAELVDR